MSHETVAICIPTYNQSGFLTSAVESACSQTYPNVEVWVSDDCSTDDTELVAKTLTTRFPQLRYHRQEHNLGISANNNWLLSQPQADFIVRLDSDDILHTDYVINLILLMDAYPNAGYAHCAVQEINEQDQPQRIRRLGGRQVFQSPEQALRASANGYRVAANICMFRAKVLSQSPIYRSGMNFCEDWDLSVRIADQGWGNAYCDKLLASYRVWEDANKVRPRRKKIEIEGYIQVFEDSLAPAFRKRGWNLASLNSRRRAIALGHTTVLDSHLFSSEERDQLLSLLNTLGPSARLRFQAKLMHLGFGPMIRWINNQKIMFKDSVKKLLAMRNRHSVST